MGTPKGTPLTIIPLHGVGEGDEDTEGDGMGTARDTQLRGANQGSWFHL